MCVLCSQRQPFRFFSFLNLLFVDVRLLFEETAIIKSVIPKKDFFGLFCYIINIGDSPYLIFKYSVFYKVFFFCVLLANIITIIISK